MQQLMQQQHQAVQTVNNSCTETESESGAVGVNENVDNVNELDG